MKEAILAIDQGTTSSRAIIYDISGKMVCSAQQEFSQIYPRPGWVEHDPEEIWRTVLYTVQSVVNEASQKGYVPVSCGITNQRETTIIWDIKTGEPIYNAIVWQDRRTADICQKLKAEALEETVTKTTGLLLDPYFSATKIAWVLDNVSGARERANRGELAFGTVDSFLIWRLTCGQVHACDATNASRTALYDIGKGKWSEEMLQVFDVPSSLLPKVKDCVANYGNIAPDHCGIDIPIRGVAGDQQAASIGQSCFRPGDLKSTFGTGSFLLVNTGDELLRSKHRLLGTIAYQIDGRITYALEGSILSAGSTIQWVRDGLGLIKNASECEALASSIPDTSGVVLVPAFVGLGAPHWKSEAKGALLGLSRGSGKEQIVRAALESVVYQTFDLVQALAQDGVDVRAIRVDGGMVRNNWLLQFLSDILSVPVERPVNIESTAIGAAGLAMMGIGLRRGLNELSDIRKIDQQFCPQMDDDLRQKFLEQWQTAMKQVLAAV